MTTVPRFADSARFAHRRMEVIVVGSFASDGKANRSPFVDEGIRGIVELQEAEWEPNHRRFALWKRFLDLTSTTMTYWFGSGSRGIRLRVLRCIEDLKTDRLG